jgi:hypothetical protein
MFDEAVCGGRVSISATEEPVFHFAVSFFDRLQK